MKRNLLVVVVLMLLVLLGCAPSSAPTVTVTQTVAPTPTPVLPSAEATTPTPSPTPTLTLTPTPALTTTPTPTATTSPASKTPLAPPSPPTQPTAPTITTSPAGQTTTSPSQPTQPSKTTTPTQPSAPAEAKRVEPNPAKGFNYAYYLYIPGTMKKITYLLVESNNSEGGTSDDQAVHDEAARTLAQDSLAPLAEALGTPALVPAFPLPAKYNTGGAVNLMDTQALDRATLVTQVEDLKRLDLQLIAMIDDAIEKSALKGITLDKKVLMRGFSTDGMFASRFTILHPDRIQAAVIGSPGGWPTAPVGQWQGTTLNYPMGVADLKQIVGKEFDIQSFKSVPLYFYLGNQDTNQYNGSDQQLMYQFGATPVARWPVAEKMYQSAGCSSQFILYPGVGHETTNEEWEDIITFFSNHLEPR